MSEKEDVLTSIDKVVQNIMSAVVKEPDVDKVLTAITLVYAMVVKIVEIDQERAVDAVRKAIETVYAAKSFTEH